MRLFLVSLVIALVCLYPEVAKLMDWNEGRVPFLVTIPYMGLCYIKVFFHEIGHTVTFWSYGQPAVPAFNFVDGGGVAMPLMERSLVLQAGIYIAFAALAFQLFRHEAWGLLTLFAVIICAHLFFAFGENRYQLAVGYMGAGGAIIAGCYCMLRAAANWTYSAHSPMAERYINMIFGIFAVAQSFSMSLGLILNDFAREIYLQGIGGHLTNDFTVIADQLDTRLENVAWFSIAFAVLCLIITAIAFFLHWRHHGFEEHAKF